MMKAKVESSVLHSIQKSFVSDEVKQTLINDLDKSSDDEILSRLFMFEFDLMRKA